jgi:HNH endonuclease
MAVDSFSEELLLVRLTRRFWRRVDTSAADDGCWLWLGAEAAHGYGHLYVDGRFELAHRVSWRLSKGPIPPGLSVLHRCDNPPCVRPRYLFTGTLAENQQDCLRKGRRPPLPRITKLSDAQVVQIRAAAGTTTYRALGSAFGVSGEQIRRIVNGTSRVDVRPGVDYCRDHPEKKGADVR